MDLVRFAKCGVSVRFVLMAPTPVGRETRSTGGPSVPPAVSTLTKAQKKQIATEKRAATMERNKQLAEEAREIETAEALVRVPIPPTRRPGTDLSDEQLNMLVEMGVTMNTTAGPGGFTQDTMKSLMLRGLAPAVQPRDRISALEAARSRAPGDGSDLQIVHVTDAAEVAAQADQFTAARLTFALNSAQYESFPTIKGGEAASSTLTANLRIFVTDHRPSPVTPVLVLRHLAEAAPSQHPGSIGERIAFTLSRRATALEVGFLNAHAFAAPDGMDTAPVVSLLSREVIRHMAHKGSDPAHFLRDRLLDLQIDADKRLLKNHLTASAGRTALTALTPFSAPAPFSPRPPPGLGYGSSLPPFPPMVGLPGQSQSDRLRRWIRYPRDTNRLVIMAACMLCGKGSTPSSVGHRSDACQATSQEQDQWIQQAIPVQ